MYGVSRYHGPFLTQKEFYDDVQGLRRVDRSSRTAEANAVCPASIDNFTKCINLHSRTNVLQNTGTSFIIFVWYELVNINVLLLDNWWWWDNNWRQPSSPQRQVGTERFCKTKEFDIRRPSLHRTCWKSASAYNEKIRRTRKSRKCTTYQGNCLWTIQWIIFVFFWCCLFFLKFVICSFITRNNMSKFHFKFAD